MLTVMMHSCESKVVRLKRCPWNYTDIFFVLFISCSLCRYSCICFQMWRGILEVHVNIYRLKRVIEILLNLYALAYLYMYTAVYSYCRMTIKEQNLRCIFSSTWNLHQFHFHFAVAPENPKWKRKYKSKYMFLKSAQTCHWRLLFGW